jgi:hypothetical protein
MLLKLEILIETFVKENLFFFKKRLKYKKFNYKVKLNYKFKSRHYLIKLKEDSVNLNSFRNIPRGSKNHTPLVYRRKFRILSRRYSFQKVFKFRKPKLLFQNSFFKSPFLKHFKLKPHTLDFDVAVALKRKIQTALPLPYVFLRQTKNKLQNTFHTPKNIRRIPLFLPSTNILKKDIFNIIPIKKILKNKILKFTSNYSYLYTKHKLPCICNHLGMIIPSRYFIFKITTQKTSIFKLKKKMYSFLKTNEHKMFIFNNKKKLILRNITKKIKSLNFFKKKLFFSNKIFFNYFKSITKSKSSNILNNSNNVFLVDQIYNKSNRFKYRVFDTIKYRREVRIPRIKFKPGYQRL